MDGIEQHPSVGVVDRYSDLHLEHAIAADPHLVREHHRVTNCPIIVLLGLTDELTAFDDPVFERIESDFDVLVLE